MNTAVATYLKPAPADSINIWSNHTYPFSSNLSTINLLKK